MTDPLDLLADSLAEPPQAASPTAPDSSKTDLAATARPARPKREELPALARSYAEKYGVDPDIFERQIDQESRWNQFARSPKGALGLSQFMPATGRQYGLVKSSDFLNAHKSLEAGARHMKDLLDQNGGDYDLALAAYNAGQGAVDKHGGVPPYRETHAYIKAIRGAPAKSRDNIPNNIPAVGDHLDALADMISANPTDKQPTTPPVSAEALPAGDHLDVLADLVAGGQQAPAAAPELTAEAPAAPTAAAFPVEMTPGAVQPPQSVAQQPQGAQPGIYDLFSEALGLAPHQQVSPGPPDTVQIPTFGHPKTAPLVTELPVPKPAQPPPWMKQKDIAPRRRQIDQAATRLEQAGGALKQRGDEFAAASQALQESRAALDKQRADLDAQVQAAQSGQLDPEIYKRNAEAFNASVGEYNAKVQAQQTAVDVFNQDTATYQGDFERHKVDVEDFNSQIGVLNKQQQKAQARQRVIVAAKARREAEKLKPVLDAAAGDISDFETIRKQAVDLKAQGDDLHATFALRQAFDKAQQIRDRYGKHVEVGIGEGGWPYIKPAGWSLTPQGRAADEFAPEAQSRGAQIGSQARYTPEGLPPEQAAFYRPSGKIVEGQATAPAGHTTEIGRYEFGLSEASDRAANAYYRAQTQKKLGEEEDARHGVIANAIRHNVFQVLANAGERVYSSGGALVGGLGKSPLGLLVNAIRPGTTEQADDFRQEMLQIADDVKQRNDPGAISSKVSAVVGRYLPLLAVPGGVVGFGVAEAVDAIGHDENPAIAVKRGLTAIATAQLGGMLGKLFTGASTNPIKAYFSRAAGYGTAPAVVKVATGEGLPDKQEATRDLVFGMVFAFHGSKWHADLDPLSPPKFFEPVLEEAARQQREAGMKPSEAEDFALNAYREAVNRTKVAGVSPKDAKASMRDLVKEVKEAVAAREAGRGVPEPGAVPRATPESRSTRLLGNGEEPPEPVDLRRAETAPKPPKGGGAPNMIPLAPGEVMSEAVKSGYKAPWEMSREEFDAAAKRGRIGPTSDLDEIKEVVEGRKPIVSLQGNQVVVKGKILNADAVAPYLKSKGLDTITYKLPGDTETLTVGFKPENRARAEEFKAAHLSPKGPLKDAEMGRLLGYSSNDVAAYLKRDYGYDAVAKVGKATNPAKPFRAEGKLREALQAKGFDDQAINKMSAEDARQAIWGAPQETQPAVEGETARNALQEPSAAPISTTKGVESDAVEEGKQQGNDEGKLRGIRSEQNVSENRSEVRQADSRQTARSGSAERGGQEQFAAKPEEALAPRRLDLKPDDFASSAGRIPADVRPHPAYSEKGGFGVAQTDKTGAYRGYYIGQDKQPVFSARTFTDYQTAYAVGAGLKAQAEEKLKPEALPAHAEKWLNESLAAEAAPSPGKDESPAPSSRVNLLNAPQGKPASPGVKRLIEEKRKVEEKAARDDLTGLQNQNQWKAAQPRIDADPNLHIARLDINRLKAVNDTHGHEAGDAYIAQAGKIIGEEATKAGISPRLQFRSGTGDEFTLAGEQKAVTEAAKTIQTRIASEVKLPDNSYGSVAFGVAPREKAADALMYANKKAMKAAVSSETPKAAGIAKKTATLTDILKQAKRTARIGSESITESDPIAQRVLKSRRLNEAEEFIASKSKVLTISGAGVGSFVIDLNNGQVARIGIGQVKQVPDISTMLQPVEQHQFGGLRVELFPKVETAGMTNADVQAVAGRLKKQGYDFPDAGTDNIGRLPDGSLVVIDPGAIQKSKRPTRAEAIKLAQEAAARRIEKQEETKRQAQEKIATARAEKGVIRTADGTEFSGKGAKAKAEMHDRQMALVGKFYPGYGSTDEVLAVRRGPSGSYVYDVRAVGEKETRTHASVELNQNPVGYATAEEAEANRFNKRVAEKRSAEAPAYKTGNLTFKGEPIYKKLEAKTDDDALLMEAIQQQFHAHADVNLNDRRAVREATHEMSKAIASSHPGHLASTIWGDLQDVAGIISGIKDDYIGAYAKSWKQLVAVIDDAILARRTYLKEWQLNRERYLNEGKATVKAAAEKSTSPETQKTATETKSPAAETKAAPRETRTPSRVTKSPTAESRRKLVESLNDDDLWGEPGQASLTPRGWQIADTTLKDARESDQALFSLDGDYLAANAAAVQALSRAYGKTVRGVTFTTPQARGIAAKAAALAVKATTPVERDNLRALAMALTDAARNNEEFGVGRPRSLFHEVGHVAQLALKRFFGRDIMPEDAEALPEYRVGEKGLNAKGYIWLADPRVIAHEVYAHIAGGQWAEIGLNVAQAARFVEGYYKLIAKTYRADALKRFNRLDAFMENLHAKVLGETRRAEADQYAGAAARAIQGGAGRPGGDYQAPDEAAADREAREDLTRQTETPEFKRWFAGSRVVDEQGEPLVVDGMLINSQNKPRPLPPAVRQTTDFARELDNWRLSKGLSKREGYRAAKEEARFDDKWPLAYSEDHAPIFNSTYWNTGPQEPTYRLAYRFKDIPQGELSTNHVSGRRENGLSVAGYLSEDEDTAYDLSHNADKPKYIVGGWDLGATGSDGEPLLLYPTVFGKAEDIGKVVKSAVGNRGTFDPDNPDILADLADLPLPPRVVSALVAITQSFIESGESDFDVLMSEIEDAVSADKFGRISPHLTEIVNTVYDKLEGPTASVERSQPARDDESNRQAAIARLKQRRVDQPRTVITIKPAKPRDVSIKPADSLLAAIQKIGIDPTTPEGSDLARYLDPREGGRPGMLRKAKIEGGQTRGIDHLLDRLAEEGWHFEGKNELFEAVRREQAGYKIYSTAKDFDVDFEKALKEEFGATAKTDARIGSIRDILNHPEARAIADGFSNGEYDDETAAWFTQIARYELNVPEEIIEAALADARETAEALRVDRLGYADIAPPETSGAEPRVGDVERQTSKQAADVARTPAEEAYLRTYGHDLSIVSEAQSAGLTTDQFDRVRSLYESLKARGESVDDYLRQQGLFGDELNQAQQVLLKRLATKGRRTSSGGEQGELFADLAPRLSAEDLADLRILAVYHAKSGASDFSAFRKAMLEDAGEWAEPFLRELHAETVRAAASLAETPKVTGTKQAQTAQEREARGLSPVEKQAYTGMGEAFLAGKHAVESGAIDPRALAAEIGKKPHALSSTEVGALGYHRTRLMNEHADAMAQITKAIDSQDAALEINQRARVSRIEEDFALNDEALQKGGREQSAAFNARKMMIAEDYSLVAVVNRMTAAKGEPLTSEERARLEKLVAEENQAAQDLKKRLDKAEAEIKRLKAERAVRGMRQAGQARPKEKLDAEVKSLVGQLAKLGAASESQPMADLEIDRAPALKRRGLRGDGLLNAQDLIDELLDQGAEIDKSAFVTLYHRTSPEKAARIIESGQMTGDEDGIFFSTHPTGLAKGYGTAVIQTRLPVEKIEIDDTFGGEAHVRLPLSRAGAKAVVKAEIWTPKEPEPFADLAPPEEPLTPDHPEVARIVKTLARNRVEAGLDSAEAVTDAVFDLVKDHVPGITKRDVADIWSGAARPSQRTKGEIALRLAEVRRQQKLLNEIEDAERGITPASGKAPSRQASQRVEALRKQLDGILRQQGLKTDRQQSPEARLKAAKTRLTKELDQLRADLTAGNYTKAKRPASTLAYDKEANDLRAARDTARDEIEQIRIRMEHENRSGGQKFLDAAVGWRRAILLSSIQTLAKLTAAATARNITTPIEEIIGTGLRVIPGVRAISKRAPRHGRGFNPKAEAAALMTIVNKALYGPEGKISEAAIRTLKTGRTKLDIVYGGKKVALDPEFIDWFAHMHGALKTQPKIAEFQRSFVQNTDWAYRESIKKGATPDEAQALVASPDMQIEIGMRAYVDANRAILMQDNAAVTLFQMINGWLSNRGPAGKLASAGLRFVFPIVKVGTNYVIETSDIIAGGPKGLARLIYAGAFGGGSGKGGGGGGFKPPGGGRWSDSLSPDDADYIMRVWKKQGFGLGLMALGWLAYGLIGGMFQQGEKRKKEDVPVGKIRIRIFGIQFDAPKYLAHNPALEAVQLAATLHRLYDRLHEKSESKWEAGSEAATETAKSMVEEVPFIGEPMRMAKQSESPSFVGRWFGENAKEMIVPPDVERAAKAFDPAEPGGFIEGLKRFSGFKQPEFKRKTEGVKETIEAAIPGLRKNVPLVRGVPDDVGKELQSADKPLGKPKRKEDESLKDYNVRVEKGNQQITLDVRTLAATDEFKNATRDERRRMLKEAIQHARKQVGEKVQETDAEHELWQQKAFVHDKILDSVKAREEFKALSKEGQEAVTRGVSVLLERFDITTRDRKALDDGQRSEKARILIERLHERGAFDAEIERLILRAQRKAA